MSIDSLKGGTRAPGPVAGLRGRGLQITREALVSIGPLIAGTELPSVVTPAGGDLDLKSWAADNQEFIESNLLKAGGILFRGFKVRSPEQFENIVAAISPDTLDYRERSSPRSQISNKIYTSTDYPPDQSIFLHNENSYQQTWPMKIFFFCETTATQGGETPIADSRRIYSAIAREVRERFAETGWMYVRNFSEQIGLSWQTVFQTNDSGEVERYCQAHGIETEWLDGNRLRTRARRRAIVRHPRTQDLLWFNHIAFFHISTLPEAIRNPLLAEFTEEDLPANSYYGDGAPIEPEALENVRNAYQQATVRFPWQRGDMLLLDNMLTAHGRAPFAGNRRILVSMAEPSTLA